MGRDVLIAGMSEDVIARLMMVIPPHGAGLSFWHEELLCPQAIIKGEQFAAHQGPCRRAPPRFSRWTHLGREPVGQRIQQCGFDWHLDMRYRGARDRLLNSGSRCSAEHSGPDESAGLRRHSPFEPGP